jgi:uncharacterized protein (DUF2336 family)
MSCAILLQTAANRSAWIVGMSVGQSLIAELDDAIKSGSKDKRVDTLRRITDLFVAGADRFNDHQIEVFDSVLGRLIERIEARALVELSQRLAPINNAPIEIVRRLAGDENITVAEPILSKSTRLSDDDLIEIANTKTQEHLLAISSRSRIAAPVTDVLLRRGDDRVYHRLAENPDASFSEDGFAALVKHAEKDEGLAEKVGLRFDIPLRLFRELLLRATEAVRSRLLAASGPNSRDHIQDILAAISDDADRHARKLHDRDYTQARERVLAMQARGKLNNASFFEFAKSGCYAEIVAALSVLNGAPLQLMEKLLQSEHIEAFLVPCKASDLEWATARLILTCRTVGHKTTAKDLDRAQTDYAKLSTNIAQRILRFWQVRETASNAAAPAP